MPRTAASRAPPRPCGPQARSHRLRWGVGAGLLLLGCGAGQLSSATTAPVPPAPRGTVATASRASRGELDVIANGEPDEGAPPLEVQFTASVHEEGGPWSFWWDFGDGKTSTEQNPRHVYEMAGEYTAALIITDEKGNADTDEVDVSVEPRRVQITPASPSAASSSRPRPSSPW